MLGKDTLGVLFPVRVLEPFIGFRPFGNDLTTRFVVFVVVNEKLFGGQEVFENLLVLLPIPIHYPVGFLDQESGGAQSAAPGILVVAVATLDILENLGGLRVPEEFTKEAYDLGVRRFMGAHVLTADLMVHGSFVIVLVGKQALNFSTVVFLGFEPALLGGLG